MNINLPTIQPLSKFSIKDVDVFIGALYSNDYEKIKWFIDNGFDVDTKNINGFTPLITASFDGRLNVVNKLIELGANVNKSTDFPAIEETLDYTHINNPEKLHGFTPLIYASSENNLDIVKTLIKHGANVNHINVQGNVKDKTALMVSSKYGHVEVVKELIKSGEILSDNPNEIEIAFWNDNFSVIKELLKMKELERVDGSFFTNTVNEAGESLLSIASMLILVDIVEQLLEYPNIGINDVNTDGKTALMSISQFGDLSIFKMLLRYPGIDVNIQDKDGNTALMLALKTRDDPEHMYSFVGELLEVPNININLKNKSGKTAVDLADHKIKSILNNWGKEQNPLITASKNGNLSRVKELLKTININSIDLSGKTPLIMASKYNHVDVVEELLKHKQIKINLVDTFGKSALMFASENNINVVKLLLDDEGTRINDSNEYGWTASLYASVNNKFDVIREFLKYKNFNVNYQGDSGWTVLMYSSLYGNIPMIKLLLFNGADKSIANDDGLQALYFAKNKEIENALSFKIDWERVNVGRTTKNNNYYKKNELVTIFKQLDIPNKGSKAELVHLLLKNKT